MEEVRRIYYRNVCVGIGIENQTHTHTHTHTHKHTHNCMCTQHYYSVYTQSLYWPHACLLSVLRHTDYTLQFSLALATAVSVFVMLWCSDVKISWLGAWASRWHPPHVLARY